MTKHEKLGEKWKSQNAQRCINNFEYPIPMFTKKNLSKFLLAYQTAYPSRVSEYVFLSKLSVSDWKFCAKQYKCTSWHHYGPTAQRTGFWDLWALAEEVLLKCRISDTNYQYQLLINHKASVKLQTRNRTNEMYQKNQVRLGVIKFLSSAGIVYAPCIIQERWGKSRKQDIVYFDYVQIREYHKCDSPNLLNTEDIQQLPEFAITNIFRKCDKETFSKFSIFKRTSFDKLIDYANENQLSISVLSDDPRPRLTYKGPPKP